MNLILTSDFPATPNRRVVEAMQDVAEQPRIAWIASHTEADGPEFVAALAQFGALGFTQLECVDIDEDLDAVQIAYLHEFDVVFLRGEDAVRLRYNAIRSGLAGRLRQFAAAGRLVVGASGGAALLTPNVSLFRLHHEPVASVLATRARYDAMGAVDYELLPHAGRPDAAFLTKLHEYSTHVENDIVALTDGSAVFSTGSGTFDRDGTVSRYRKGQIINS